MIKINLRESIDLIKESLENSSDKALECDLIGLTKNGKDKIRFLINYISKKYLIEKYSEDLCYIILEIIVNALKADYAHLITITNLKMLKNKYREKIDDGSYLYDSQIMTEYTEILKDESTKEEVKDMINLEGEVFKNLEKGRYDEVNKKYERLHFFKEAFNNKPVIIKFYIIDKEDRVIFRIKNNSPLTISSRTRIDTKRITFKEYYDNSVVDRFFLEQIDSSESAGFGIALIDLRLLNFSLNPFKHFFIYSKGQNTYSEIIIPKAAI